MRCSGISCQMSSRVNFGHFNEKVKMLILTQIEVAYHNSWLELSFTKDQTRRSSVPSMLADLNWPTLEERRISARLSLLYKSLHHLVAIDLNDYILKPDNNGITTRKSSSISFHHPAVKKDCYRFSFIPRTVAEWNCLPSAVRDSPSIETFRNQLRKLNLTSLRRSDSINPI